MSATSQSELTRGGRYAVLAAAFLPELFPTHMRATGAGVSMNIGWFATAGGVLAAGALFEWFGGDYAMLGGACALIYAAGMLVIWWAPATDERGLG